MKVSITCHLFPGNLRHHYHCHCISAIFFALIFSMFILNWKQFWNGSDNWSLNRVAKHTDNIRLLQNLLSEQNGSLCARLRKPLESEINHRNKYWQAHEDVKNRQDIVVYSAFYDDRKIVGSLPWIRITGIRKKSNATLWCYLWYSEFGIPIVTQAEIITTMVTQTVAVGSYSPCLFSCPLTRNSSTPTHVSLINNPCNSSTILLPVRHPLRSDGWLHEFAVCLKSYSGYFPPEWIAQWMELHAMFGVTKVNVYNGSLDGRMDAVFEYYRKKGLVEIHQMPAAVNDSQWKGIRVVSQVAYNDCMMRNMYSARFLVVVDFDEVIVPGIQKTYREMLVDVDRMKHLAESYHTYSFRMAYFFRYFAKDVSQPKFLPLSRMNRRAPPSGYLFGGKSFVDPRQCKSLFNHYCWTRFNRTGRASIDVSTTVALLHHYREKCSFKKDACDAYDKNQMRDDSMLRYKNELMERIPKVLKAIGHSQYE